MDIISIKIEFRTPTVQYGYINTLYEVMLNEEAGDTIKHVVRHIAIENEVAVGRALQDIEKRRAAEKVEGSPF